MNNQVKVRRHTFKILYEQSTPLAFGARCTKLSLLGHGGVDLFHRDIRIYLLTILKRMTKRHNRKAFLKLFGHRILGALVVNYMYGDPRSGFKSPDLD